MKRINRSILVCVRTIDGHWAMECRSQRTASSTACQRERVITTAVHIVELKGKTSVYRFLHVITNWDLSLPRAIWPNTQHLKFKWDQTHTNNQQWHFSIISKIEWMEVTTSGTSREKKGESEKRQKFYEVVGSRRPRRRSFTSTQSWSRNVGYILTHWVAHPFSGAIFARDTVCLQCLQSSRNWVKYSREFMSRMWIVWREKNPPINQFITAFVLTKTINSFNSVVSRWTYHKSATAYRKYIFCTTFFAGNFGKRTKTINVSWIFASRARQVT